MREGGVLKAIQACTIAMTKLLIQCKWKTEIHRFLKGASAVEEETESERDEQVIKHPLRSHLPHTYSQVQHLSAAGATVTAGATSRIHIHTSSASKDSAIIPIKYWGPKLIWVIWHRESVVEWLNVEQNSKLLLKYLGWGVHLFPCFTADQLQTLFTVTDKCKTHRITNSDSTQMSIAALQN